MREVNSRVIVRLKEICLKELRTTMLFFWKQITIEATKNYLHVSIKISQKVYLSIAFFFF